MNGLESSHCPFMRKGPIPPAHVTLYVLSLRENRETRKKFKNEIGGNAFFIYLFLTSPFVAKQ